MTTVTSAAAGASSATTSQVVTEEATTTLADYDDFLQLLTAQLENQDPLNPMDSTQFVEQLATFSSLEQQVASNDKLDQLISLQSATQLADANVYLGQDVVSTFAVFEFDGFQLQATPPVDDDADAVAVTIRDLNGREMATIEDVDMGRTFTWTGATNAGGQAPVDYYTVEYVYTTEDGVPAERWSVPASGQGTVTEIQLDNNGGLLLKLENNALVAPEQVISVGVSDSDPNADDS